MLACISIVNVRPRQARRWAFILTGIQGQSQRRGRSRRRSPSAWAAAATAPGTRGGPCSRGGTPPHRPPTRLQGVSARGRLRGLTGCVHSHASSDPPGGAQAKAIQPTRDELGRVDFLETALQQRLTEQLCVGGGGLKGVQPSSIRPAHRQPLPTQDRGDPPYIQDRPTSFHRGGGDAPARPRTARGRWPGSLACAGPRRGCPGARPATRSRGSHPSLLRPKSPPVSEC